MYKWLHATYIKAFDWAHMQVVLLLYVVMNNGGTWVLENPLSSLALSSNKTM